MVLLDSIRNKLFVAGVIAAILTVIMPEVLGIFDFFVYVGVFVWALKALEDLYTVKSFSERAEIGFTKTLMVSRPVGILVAVFGSITVLYSIIWSSASLTTGFVAAGSLGFMSLYIEFSNRKALKYVKKLVSGSALKFSEVKSPFATLGCLEKEDLRVYTMYQSFLDGKMMSATATSALGDGLKGASSWLYATGQAESLYGSLDRGYHFNIQLDVGTENIPSVETIQGKSYKLEDLSDRDFKKFAVTQAGSELSFQHPVFFHTSIYTGQDVAYIRVFIPFEEADKSDLEADLSYLKEAAERYSASRKR